MNHPKPDNVPDHFWAPFLAWLETRPECIQKLGLEFPVGMEVEVPHLGWCYLVGYGEPDSLLLSPVNPGASYGDYDRALAERFDLCAEHVRDGSCAMRRLDWSDPDG